MKYQKKDPERVNIFIDEEYRFSLHVNNLIKYDIHVGKELTEEEIYKIVIDDVESRMHRRAVEYILRSPHTEYQIRQYIRKVLYQKKGDWYPTESDLDTDVITQKVVNKMEKEKLLNDAEYARFFVESRIRSKPRSKFKLVGELLERGVEKELAKDTVDTLVVDEGDTARKILMKKYGNDRINRSDHKKIQFLQRNGFSWDIISQLVSDDI